MQINQNIIEGCISQNRTCQEMAYKHFYGYLIAVGNRYLNDTNDVKLMVNETFFKAFAKIDSYNKDIVFEVWLRRIMINNCIDFLRKTKKVRFHETNVEDFGNTNYESNTINYAEFSIEANHLKNMLLQVPETSRKVFCLFAIEGYSHKEISEILEINEGTSKWHVNNARKILKKEVIDYNVAQNKPINYLTKVQ